MHESEERNAVFGGQPFERVALTLWCHRPGNHEALPRRGRGGADEILQEHVTILAAAGGGQHHGARPVFARRNRAVNLVDVFRILQVGDVTAEMRARFDGFGKFVRGERVEDRTMPVNEDRVVKVRDALLHMVGPPLLQHAGRFVQNVAQTEDGFSAEFLEHTQAVAKFATGSERMFSATAGAKDFTAVSNIAARNQRISSTGMHRWRAE